MDVIPNPALTHRIHQAHNTHVNLEFICAEKIYFQGLLLEAEDVVDNLLLLLATEERLETRELMRPARKQTLIYYVHFFTPGTAVRYPPDVTFSDFLNLFSDS